MATLQFSEGTNVPKILHRRKQLLPNIVDGMANTRPSALYAETPRSLTTFDAGYRKITYGALANAINGVAWLLEEQLGRGSAHDTLAYIGPNDLGYVVMILGAVKAGYKAGGLYPTLLDAIANQTTVITSLAGVTPSAQLVVDGLKHTKADSILLAPSFMEQIAKSPEMLDFVTSNVETIFYGGGDVSQLAGSAIASRSKVMNFNGSTETGGFPILRPSGKYPSEDWKYLHLHPAAGIEFRPSLNRLFEAFIVRNPNFEDEQPVFKVFPELKEYSTNDLWAPHPSKPNLWAYHGRADDIIVFGPGYMSNPLAMEQQVANHPKVRDALMVGTGRFQPALLVEPTSDQPLSAAEKNDLIEELFSVVREANRGYKIGARVSKSHILFTDLENPMRRAGKGTVQRAPTLESYKDALDALYSREGDAVSGNEMNLPIFGSEIEKD